MQSLLRIIPSRLTSSVCSSSRYASSLSTRLIGKTAIVTASTDGIGFSIAKKMLDEGANLMISSRKQENVDAALERLKDEVSNVKEGQLEGMVCHVGDKAHRTELVKTTVEKFGGLDILISNAAVNPYYGPIMGIEESQWEKIFDINVKCAYLLSQECLPHLKKTKGNIVFVSSIAGYQPLAGLGPYSVSKTALLGLTKAMAVELGPNDGIRVNCLAPGIVKTKFSTALTEDEKLSKAFMHSVPLRRFAEPDDMAGTVAFLASDDAKYVTGETICCTGGMISHL